MAFFWKRVKRRAAVYFPDVFVGHFYWSIFYWFCMLCIYSRNTQEQDSTEVLHLLFLTPGLSCPTIRLMHWIFLLGGFASIIASEVRRNVFHALREEYEVVNVSSERPA